VSEVARADVLLSIQRALLGAVGPSLLAASVEWTERTIDVTWYVAASLSADERQDLLTAGGMVAGDFSDEIELSEHFVEVAASGQPAVRGAWVFLRRELT
jgi:hypothetical protein